MSESVSPLWRSTETVSGTDLDQAGSGGRGREDGGRRPIARTDRFLGFFFYSKGKSSDKFEQPIGITALTQTHTERERERAYFAYCEVGP